MPTYLLALTGLLPPECFQKYPRHNLAQVLDGASHHLAHIHLSMPRFKVTEGCKDSQTPAASRGPSQHRGSWDEGEQPAYWKDQGKSGEPTLPRLTACTESLLRLQLQFHPENLGHQTR